MLRRSYAYAPRRRRRRVGTRRIAVARVPRYATVGPVSVGGRRRRRRARGGNIFRKIWRGVKSVARPVHNFVRSNKLVSRGLRLLPQPWAGPAANAAAALGYGVRGGMYRVSPGPYIMVT